MLISLDGIVLLIGGKAPEIRAQNVEITFVEGKQI
jgi:hypothetical protein